MDSRSEISSFLTSRRARLSPEEAGVPRFGGARRVPGLRREEVAHLAGVSADHYARLERGRISGASREVLEAVARALQRELIEIVGTLTTRSEEFSELWASHDVLRHRSGTKLLTHPDVGDLEFGYESFELSTDPGLVILVFTVEPGSRTAEAMQLLASWAAPPHSEDEAPGTATGRSEAIERHSSR
ncbi:Helix-turn-helix domain-containing protein [Saccharopolyspora antimicrobica]|uniref:Helix-turn-helix domain-containing protein n=1 Tax=Saccharopolyspora antimicrobica TaxID=455193 RepID=A0A1I4ZXA6_9PSEU|nr:helix-turn-helix domain-containing protein [Saccharopolyspora antimicrobica]RKT83368.1 helix-turn-helix protein [Saccharopolyspora antimicrobica]SFN54699.1 Helix-turn-helix domain-containing protein [Saccharopolyspora antimicrobica]